MNAKRWIGGLTGLCILAGGAFFAGYKLRAEDVSSPYAHFNQLGMFECSFCPNEAEEYKISDATCTKGAVYDYACVLCGKASGGQYTFVVGEPLGHTGGEATEDECATCDRCGQHYGEKLK